MDMKETGFMNYSTDKPINTEEQDLLGRTTFSKQLGKAICEYNAKDGLVIGLFGKWGSGKTSVINMAENEINRLTKEDENKPLFMRFSPWNYSDKDNLISLFFQSLKNKIEIQDDEQIKNKLGKALRDYAEVFDVLSLVPVIGSGVATILKTLSQVQGTNLMQVPDLDKTKENLEYELIKADKKIIIVIDDIDRLNNSQIRDVFQLVKQVADFPNVIYMLVMDREVVCRALTEVHNIDGNEYLEKIIQVPFEIPEVRKTKLNNVLFTKLDQIINNLSNEIIIDKNYWGEVFENCISPYINTLRDVNRVVNTFQFRYVTLHQETSFEDMLGITTLEVLEPDLYKWIFNNKDAVCTGIMHGLTSNKDNKQDYRKLYQEEFENMGIDSNVAIKCISTMFPVFGKKVNEYNYFDESMSDIRGKMRVAHKERFELYFIFDLDDIKVSRNIINDCIFYFDSDTLSTVIEKINKKGNIIYFLEEMRSLCDKIPYERLSIIVSVILDLHGKFEGENSRIIFTLSASDIANYFIEDIFKKINSEEEKYQIIRSSLEKIDKNGLAAMARIINSIELSYGRLAGDSENKDKQIISLAHLEELEKIYVEKIRSITSSESISDIKWFGLVFYLWECFDEKGVSEYLEKLFESEVNILKFICSIASKWQGTDGIRWDFSRKNYQKYISQDKVYTIIQNFDKNKLYKFTDIEKIKLASFVMNYQKNEMDYVNEQEAKKLVNQWETEKNKQLS